MEQIMTTKLSPINVLSLCLLGCSLFASAAYAADADWKRGRVYYRYVCTTCHTSQPGGAIAPNTKTVAEWTAYMQAGKHAKGKEPLNKYLSKEYRASIKATNKAAEKYADVPDQQLFIDVKAFLLKGAKDGDAPASCS
jgi:mono/diheme cytochrome c family protein